MGDLSSDRWRRPTASALPAKALHKLPETRDGGELAKIHLPRTELYVMRLHKTLEENEGNR